jgi:uncharacterized membrane protein
MRIDDNGGGVPSTASILGHPIHPMLVPFPIAFLVGAFASDLAFWGTADPFWARASVWLVGAGLATGALAALAGLTDFLTIQRVRSLSAAWMHFLGNGAALLLSLWNLLHRLGDPAAGVLPSGLILSLVVVAILLVTGWLGGELAYRHRIGMIGNAGEPRPAGASPAAGYAYAGSKPARPEAGDRVPPV